MSHNTLLFAKKCAYMHALATLEKVKYFVTVSGNGRVILRKSGTYSKGNVAMHCNVERNVHHKKCSQTAILNQT